MSHGILWIGSAAYPLRNIARAQTIKIVPKRARAIRRYVVQVVIWLVVGFVAFGAISGNRAELDELRNLAGLAVLGLIGISTIKLLMTVLRRTYYAMVIETSGSPQTALVSTDADEVSSIVRQTMDAIGRPGATFRYKIKNMNFGEHYDVSGKHAVGKQVSG